MRSIKQIIELIKQHCGVEKDKDVAKALKMNPPALSNHKRRGTIPFDDLASFCHDEWLPLDWLLTDSEAPEPTFTSRGKLPYASGVRLKEGDSREGSVEVGVFAFAGAGGPMELVEHEPIQTIDIPKHWLKAEMQAVLIRGRSMEPSIVDGAVVGVDTQDKNVVSGELYAVWLEYEGAVGKRLYMEREIVRICSDNPAFKEMQIKNDDINGETFILGKVCWLMQSY